jgi:hypothetical protein
MMIRAYPPAAVMTVMIMPAVTMTTMIDGRDNLALEPLEGGDAPVRGEGG